MSGGAEPSFFQEKKTTNFLVLFVFTTNQKTTPANQETTPEDPANKQNQQTEVRKSMLQGVARLASLVGVEQTAATLQYNGVLPYVIAQSGPNQPPSDITTPRKLASDITTPRPHWPRKRRRSRSQGFVKQLVGCWLPPDSPSLSLVVWPLDGFTQPLARARRAMKCFF